MHEYSVVRALLDQVERQVRLHRAHAVHRVRVRIGELSGVEPDLLRTAYDLARAGGPCAGAALDVVRVRARWECPDCGGEVPRGSRLSCAACGAAARLVAGDDILLERIEMEVADEAAAPGHPAEARSRSGVPAADAASPLTPAPLEESCDV